MFHQLTVLAIMLGQLTATAALPGPYLDQPPPGSEPRLFAPGIVSDGLPNRDMAITPDGKEIYWSSNLRNFEVSAILVSRLTDHGWSEPQVAPFSTNPAYAYYEPAISPDGMQFFFVASESGSETNDIWVMDRVGSAWGQPRKLGPPINTPGKEYFPSITLDGTIYFTREGEAPGTEAIYRSRRTESGYQAPEKLPASVNCGKSQFNAFIDPKERYLIVPVWGRDDSLGSIDYYVVFRNEIDEWSEPVNLGPQINTPGAQEYTPYVSPDGKFFFFMSTRSPDSSSSPRSGYSRDNLARLHEEPENGLSDIYWIDAAFIEALRPEGF
ncbi:MAG: PD40 domain-containing protein [Gammaproteobacteria bacterium]|nr:PD40 domain-containing protein [Gammaproteobacteria bacterium]